MRRLALLLVLLPACALFGPEGVYELRVANETEEPFYFFAVAAPEASLLDPMPSIPLEEVTMPRVEVGESVRVENVKPPQAAEEGVALFLYMPYLADSTRIVFAGVESFAADEVVRRRGRLVVETRQHQPH